MDQEIKNSELFLKNLAVSGGFEAPIGYFELLEMRLAKDLDQTEIKGVLGKSIFEVPADYFESLNQNILQKTIGSEAKKIPVFRQAKLYWLTGIAASALLVSLLFFVETNKKVPITLNGEISEEEIAEQLNIGDLNEAFLCDAGWCVELEKLDSKLNEVEEDLLMNSEEGLIIEEL
jgi:hypothetical protein